MRAALYCSLIVISCWGQPATTSQGAVNRKPAWLDMEKDVQAVAIRYSPNSPPSWTAALRSMEGAGGPSVVLERNHIVVWLSGARDQMLDALKVEWSKAIGKSVEAVSSPDFQTVQVYRVGKRLLIPTGELLVTFRKDVSSSAGIQILKDYGLRAADPPVQVSPGVFLAQLPADDGVKSVRMAKEMARDQRIVIAEPNLVAAAPPDRF